MTTETLDKFYLEWSQFTRARTRREIALMQAAQQVCAFDWSGNDADAVSAIAGLRDALALSSHHGVSK